MNAASSDRPGDQAADNDVNEPTKASQPDPDGNPSPVAPTPGASVGQDDLPDGVGDDDEDDGYVPL
jgi:hypothetical protein